MPDVQEAISEALWRLTDNYKRMGTKLDSVSPGVRSAFRQKAEFILNELAQEGFDGFQDHKHAWLPVHSDVAKNCGLYGLQLAWCPDCGETKKLDREALERYT